ncbi:hypothetical protein Tco_0532852 [Tanacetum coccineum]
MCDSTMDYACDKWKANVCAIPLRIKLVPECDLRIGFGNSRCAQTNDFERLTVSRYRRTDNMEISVGYSSDDLITYTGKYGQGDSFKLNLCSQDQAKKKWRWRHLVPVRSHIHHHAHSYAHVKKS